MSFKRDQIEQVLRGWGINDKPEELGDGIHSWRCEHVATYGRCDCFEDLLEELAGIS